MTILAWLLLFLLAGCLGPAAGVTTPSLGAVNGTPMVIQLQIDGVDAAELPAGQRRVLDVSTLPPLPWTVEALSPSGDVLLGLMVTREFADGTSAAADLPCGRVLVWVGDEPIFGPAPPTAMPAPTTCPP